MQTIPGVHATCVCATYAMHASVWGGRRVDDPRPLLLPVTALTLNPGSAPLLTPRRLLINSNRWAHQVGGARGGEGVETAAVARLHATSAWLLQILRNVV